MGVTSRVLNWAGPVLAAAAVTGLWAMSSSTAAVDRVPDLRGLQLDVAQVRASTSGYPTRVVLDAGPGVAGTVLDHEPPAGALQPRGSPIELRVTRGARQVRVPDVRGMPVREARQLLAEAELTPGSVTYGAAPGAEPNRVIASHPAPGASVDSGTSVHLTAATP